MKSLAVGAHYRRGKWWDGSSENQVLCYALQASLPLCQANKRCPLASLSVVVIVKNEAQNIETCLRSVAFADETVVLDSGSTDSTVEIARSLGADVHVDSDWHGFGVQKNRALALATCDWVLSIDADERVTPELESAIRNTIDAPAFDAYCFPRSSSYCGRHMRHSGWYPDHVTRLFRRGSARFSNDLVHEKVITPGPVGKLRPALLHESFRNFEAVLDKTNRYSTAGAQASFNKGRDASLGKAVAHGLWAFIRTYFLQLGVLDGRMGFILAVSNAEGTYYRYLKLWLLQRKANQVPLAK